MHEQSITQNEFKSIEAEQVRAYFKYANDLNLAGAVVFTLLIYVVHDATPWWTWLPALAALYVVSAVRAYLIHQYQREPDRRRSRQWMVGQAITGGFAGACWGGAGTAMLVYLPVTLQLFVLTVSAAVAATAMSEGFSLVLPPRFFTIASIGPVALWLFTVGDRLHTVIGLMLLIFIPVMIVLGIKRNLIFLEAQQLRFKNESLVKELSRQHELLEGASKAKSRFLAAASHDLRQPVAALMLFLEQLEFEQKMSPRGKEVLNHAQQATNSLCTLLDGLLDISRLDGHAVTPKIHSFAIRRVLDELEREFLPLAGQKSIRLKFAPCSAVIESDINLLKQILRNLISNALRYTHSGHILVGCRHRQGRLDIEVHDTGIGIAEDQFSKIFIEFYQVDNAERDRQQGLGLGLSIVDHAARLLDHQVRFSSLLGKGTTFIVSVPFAKAEVVAEQVAPVLSVENPVLSRRIIAVIENEGSIRVGIHSLLKSWGCRAVVADSAATMIKLLESLDEKVELVISDFGLSGSANGVMAIAEIRQRWGAELPALLFTGDISKETQMLAQNAGLAILYKPAKPEALRQAITEALHD